MTRSPPVPNQIHGFADLKAATSDLTRDLKVIDGADNVIVMLDSSGVRLTLEQARLFSEWVAASATRVQEKLGAKTEEKGK